MANDGLRARARRRNARAAATSLGLLVFAAGLVALLVSGLGGGSSGSATSSTAPTTTVGASLDATVTDANTPKFCTATVHLKNGAQNPYALDTYLVNVNDSYTFTAVLGGYQVDVSTKVVMVGGTQQCVSTVSHLVRV
jgi:hypothetical protein